MTKRISAMALRKHLGKIMNEVSLRDDEYIVERDGKAIVALLPLWKFEQIQERRIRFWKTVEEFRKEGRKAGKELPSILKNASKTRKQDKAS